MEVKTEKILVPKLRFSDFRNLDLEKCKFGKVVESNIYGPRFNANDYSKAGNVRTIRGTDVSLNGEFKYEQVPLAQLDKKMIQTHRLIEGDLVMITTADCGLTGVFREQEIPFLSSAYGVRIRLNKNGFPYYFKYFFQTRLAKKEIKGFVRKATVANLPGSDILRIQTYLPTLPEQQKIAAFLSAVDKKIAQLSQKKTLLETYKKGVMQKIFSQELRFKQEDGSKFPDWAEKKLGEVVIFENGKGHEKNISLDGDFVVVNSKFISTSGNVKKYTDNQICPLNKGDIVMVMSDVPRGKALAKCYFIDEDNKYSLNQRICALKPNNNDTKFLFYLINRNRYFLRFDSGVGQTNLRKDEVLSCPLTIPNSNKEQQKIASFLSALDKKIELVNTQLEQTKMFKKGLLQQMFV